MEETKENTKPKYNIYDPKTNVRARMTINDIVQGDKYDAIYSMQAAQNAIDAKNWEKAESILRKGEKMFPTAELKEMLDKVQAAKANELQRDFNISTDYRIDPTSSSSSDQALKIINQPQAQKCLEKARIALKEKNYDKAIKFIEKSEKMYPSPESKELMTKVNEALKYREQSVDHIAMETNGKPENECVTEGIQQNENNVHYNTMSTTYENSEDNVKTVYSNKITKQPKEIAKEWLDLAHDAINNKKPDDAEKFLLSSLDIYPTEEAQQMLSIFRLFMDMKNNDKHEQIEPIKVISENKADISGNSYIELELESEVIIGEDNNETEQVVQTIIEPEAIEHQSEHNVTLKYAEELSTIVICNAENPKPNMNKIPPVPAPRKTTFETKKKQDSIVDIALTHPVPSNINLQNNEQEIPPRNDLKNNNGMVVRLRKVFETSKPEEITLASHSINDSRSNSTDLIRIENLNNDTTEENEQEETPVNVKTKAFTDNMENVYKCIQIAQTALISGDLEKAERFAVKANRMQPSDVTKDLLQKICDECNNTDGTNYDDIHLNNVAKEIEAERLISIAQGLLSENKLDEAAQNLLQAQTIYPMAEAITMLTHIQLEISSQSVPEISRSTSVLANDQNEIDKSLRTAITAYNAGNLNKAKRLALKANRMQATAVTQHLLRIIQEASDNISTTSSNVSSKSSETGINDQNLDNESTVVVMDGSSKTSDETKVNNNDDSYDDDESTKGKVPNADIAEKIAREISIAALKAIANGNLYEAEQHLLNATQMFYNKQDRELLDNVQIAIAERETGIDVKSSSLKSGILNNEHNDAIGNIVTDLKGKGKGKGKKQNEKEKKQQEEMLEDSLIRHARLLQAAEIVFNRGYVNNAKIFLKEADKIRPTEHTKKLLDQIKKEKKNDICSIC